MITYKILVSQNYKDLAHKVNFNIKEGWHPLGGVTTGNTLTQAGAIKISEISYIQSMIQTKGENNEEGD